MNSPVLVGRPWLEFDLGQKMQVVSWALNRPGFVEADRIVWREVRNADLPLELDVGDWFARELAMLGLSEAVAFLTSRDIRRFTQAEVTVAGITAHAVTTVGLSNAERVGHRVDRAGKDWGTINVAVRLDHPLTQAALLEALAIAVQARTAAVMEVDHMLPTGRATGTGTDCVAIAAPAGEAPYAGLHTEVGEAVGRAAYTAVLKGAREWMETVRRPEEKV